MENLLQLDKNIFFAINGAHNFFFDFLLGDKKIRRNSEDKKEKRELLFRQPKLRK